MAAAVPAVTSTSRQEEGKVELGYFYQENINFHISFHQENINSANCSLNVIGQDQVTGRSLRAGEGAVTSSSHRSCSFSGFCEEGRKDDDIR